MQTNGMSAWKVKAYEDLSKEDLYHILKARNLVFVCEQKICYQDMDDLDQKAIHLWKMDLKSSTVAVYTRILPPGVKYPEVSFGRVLTSNAYRGKGLARELMMVCMKTIEGHFPGCNVKISAQQYLKKFYQDFGFITVGGSYIEEGIPHIGMLKTSVSRGESVT